MGGASLQADPKGSFPLKNLPDLVCLGTGFTGRFDNPLVPKIPYPKQRNICKEDSES